MGRGIQSLSGGHREHPPKSTLLGILVTGGNATGQVLGVPTTPPSNNHKTTFLQVIKQKKKATLRFSSSTIPTLGYWLSTAEDASESCSSPATYEMGDVQRFILPVHSSQFIVSLRRVALRDSSWTYSYVRLLNFIFTNTSAASSPS